MAGPTVIAWRPARHIRNPRQEWYSSEAYKTILGRRRRLDHPLVGCGTWVLAKLRALLYSGGLIGVEDDPSPEKRHPGVDRSSNFGNDWHVVYCPPQNEPSATSG